MLNSRPIFRKCEQKKIKKIKKKPKNQKGVISLKN